MKANGKEQSPPGVGRALALFSGCVYNAVAAFRSWEPAYIKEIPGENGKKNVSASYYLICPVAYNIGLST